MRRFFYVLPVIGVLALATGPATAAGQKAEAGKAGHRHAHDAFAFPPQIKLTTEQQAKLEALKKQYGPKVAEADARVAAVFTPELRKAAHEARKKAAAEGKKGKELHEAVMASLNLPAAEQTKLKEAFTARFTLAKEIHQQKLALLTDEQKAQLKQHHHKAAK